MDRMTNLTYAGPAVALAGISTDRSSSCVSASFKLSLRDLAIIMADRGITVTHTTILKL